MEWARYGSVKKSISAAYYREEKHGEIICKFCDGRMTIVRPEKRGPHFRVVDRSTHTCKYFSNAIESIVEDCKTTVRMDRKNNESPLFHLSFDGEIKNEKLTDSPVLESEDEYVPFYSSSTSSVMKGKPKLKTRFKFIGDMFSLILYNPRDEVLKCRFTIQENGVIKKIKAIDLIPSYRHLVTLNEKNKISDRKRFVVGTILSAKETINKNIEITLYGEKIESRYINHKIIIMKKVSEETGLNISDFYRDRFIMVYTKPKFSSDKKNEFVSFVHSFEDFEFGKLTSKDGDWCDSKEEMGIDNFLYFWNIRHDVPDIEVGKTLFESKNGIDQFYVPDWIIYIEGKKVIMEYFGFYTPEYMERKLRKIDYFSNLPDYLFLAIEREDLRNEYKELKNKLNHLFPSLQLN
ncbi:hypothetical protein [Paenibacillus sp. FSL P4-0288]|uniref:hypothetical protein n=1 Tax=Paenibacillus sp. FSL P4-0288 TaxID=2921633 RepID=UPI0030F9575C